MLSRVAIAVVLVACTDTPAAPTICNGHAELCSRSYDAIAFPGTHDAYANIANGFVTPSQTYTLTQQLQDGVRVLHLEINPDNDEPYLCHGICGLGKESLVDGLTEVRTFLNSSPTDVVTLLTESSEITTDQIAAAFDTANLTSLTHAHTLGDPWPTLGAMIQRGERVVVFHADLSSSGGPAFEWMLDRFSWTWETPWDNQNPVDFGRCEADRGTKGNSIYVVDTYIEGLPVATAASAAQVNTNPFLVERLLLCKQNEATLPNFVMVNYYEVGDVLHDVDVLNGFARAPDEDLSQFPPDGGYD